MIEALYIHVPFCVKRCSYCDFQTSACSDEARMDAYVDAVSLQLRRASRAGLLGRVKSIYIGGGTPTHLGARRLSSLVYLISLSVNLENVDEFTVECNPESLTDAMVRDLFALGVDRFSIGAQSFDDAVLAAYGRVHDAAAIKRAVESVKQRTGNFSLDLICGGPGQGMGSWRASVERAVASGAAHLSIYPLTLEEGTPLAVAVARGDVEAADDGLEADMMLEAQRLLEDSGFKRYEVASYARPGFRSRHNSAYWTGIEYLGLGAGASSMLSPASFAACCKAGLFASGEPELLQAAACARVRLSVAGDDLAFSREQGRPRPEHEFLDAGAALLEDAMLAMRRSEGIPSELAAKVAETVPGFLPVMEGLARKGLVELLEGAWVPTQRGWLFGNEVYAAIWGLNGD